jgi:hypothetical protein
MAIALTINAALQDVVLPTLSNGAINATVALLSAGIGGILLKLLERSFSKSDRRLDDAAKVRQELWSELERVRARIDSVERELDDWKKKYFDQYAENATLLRENTALRVENAELLSRVAQCQTCPWRAQQLFTNGE